MESSNIIAGLAALASWVALWINFRITQDSKKNLVQASWDDARTYRTTFWPIVRTAYASFRARHTAVLPEDLDALVGSAGMPPNVPVNKDRNLRSWFDDYGARLSTDQRNLWEFVSAIYPPRTGGTPDVMGISIIPDTDKKAFHRSRQVLGTFFQRGRERLPNRVLGVIAGHADDDVFLVSWLELALMRSDRDDGPGKSKLFEFGNYLWNRQR